METLVGAFKNLLYAMLGAARMFSVDLRRYTLSQSLQRWAARAAVPCGAILAVTYKYHNASSKSVLKMIIFDVPQRLVSIYSAHIRCGTYLHSHTISFGSPISATFSGRMMW